MPNQRIQGRIGTFLDEADGAASSGEWKTVAGKARATLATDKANEFGRRCAAAAPGP